MNRHPLRSRIAAIRAQVRRLAALHGLSWLTAALVLGVFFFALADWAFHLSPALRLVSLLLLAALGVYLFALLVIRPLRARLADLLIALKIEERYPGLNDRLASTIQFLDLKDAQSAQPESAPIDQGRDGSEALREATIQSTLEELDRLDISDAVDPRPTRKAALAAISAVALACVPLFIAPVTSRIALARLFQPFGKTQWPKQTHLTLLEGPAKIARGEPFQLVVGVDGKDRFPNLARASFRFEDGEVLDLSLRSDAANRRFSGRLDAVDRSFVVTVAAGDDATAPLAVSVVPPPRLTALTLRVTPPAYTGLPQETLAPGQYQVQSLRGGNLEILATASKPLASARLIPQNSEIDAPAVTLGTPPTSLSASLRIADTAGYSFEITDTEGFSSQDSESTRFEIRTQEDQAPIVEIEEPANDSDVTANASIPVLTLADDDFGLKNLRLVYQVAPSGSEPTDQISLPLWAAPEQLSQHTRHLETPYNWDLAPLGLQPGAVISLYAEALDFDNLKGPNIGKSRTIRLRIARPEEIAQQLKAQQREIRELLSRLAEMQDQAIRPVGEARRTLAQTKKLDIDSRDALANASIIQRQLTDRVNSSSDGLAQKVDRFLERLDQLKVDDPDLKSQMQGLQAAVARVQQQHLEPAEQGIVSGLKALEADQPAPEQEPSNNTPPSPAKPGAQAKDASPSPATPGSQTKDASPSPATPGSEPATKGQSDAPPDNNTVPAPAEESKKPPGAPADEKMIPSTQPENQQAEPERALAKAQDNQEAIASELRQMLDRLQEFETFAGVVQDAKKLLREHEEAMKAASELASRPELRGKSPDQLNPQEKSDLANQGARQEQVAQSLQELESRMDEMADRLDEADPLGAASLREAVKQSRDNGTAARLGETARQIQSNQIGPAQASQEQSRKELKELVENLENRREQELARLVQELKDSERALQQLRDRQEKLKQATAQAGKIADEAERKDTLQKLAKEQEQAQQELRRQLQRLQKLRAQAAAQAGARAAGRMANAQQDLDQDQADDAEQNQEQALADLQEAQEETENARREAEDRLATEQIARFADNLKSLAEQQEKLVTDTAEYDQKREKDSELTPAQRAGVRALGRVQNALQQETLGLLESLDAAPVFALTLKRAGESMNQASQRLQKLQTDAPTQQAEQNAANRFRQLLEALKPDKSGDGQPGGGGGGGGGRGGGGGQGDAITTTAQIKMLKMLQQDLNLRTESLDEVRRENNGNLNPDQQAELEGLEGDQRSILDLVRDITRPRRDDGEED